MGLEAASAIVVTAKARGLHQAKIRPQTALNLDFSFDADDRAILERPMHEHAEAAGRPNQPFAAPAISACFATLRSKVRLRPALSDA